MDVLRFLTEGNKEPNPLYNPKTKKGAKQPPFITNDEAGKDLRDKIVSATTETSNINTYSLVGLNPEEYSDYNVYINPISTEEELNKERAQNQSHLEQLAYGIGQSINEMTLGTVVGTADLASLILDAADGELSYEAPEFVQNLRQLKETVNEVMPIYRENPNSAFDVTDLAWWSSNMPSMASTISLMIPGMAVSKGIGYATTKFADKFSNILKGIQSTGKLNRTSKIANKLLSTSEKTKQRIMQGVESVAGGATMRMIENYQEANQTYQEVYNYATEQLNNMNDAAKAEFIKNNPNYANKTNDEIAKDIANKSADTTFDVDLLNTVFDIYQMYGLKNIWKNVLQGKNTTRLKRFNKNMAATFGDDEARLAYQEAAKKWTTKTKDFFKNFGQDALEGVRTEWSEGVEEAINYIASEKGMELAKFAFDKDTEKKNISDYLKDPYMWESAFWGVLGGVAFSSIGDNTIRFVQTKFNKDFQNAEEQKRKEILSREVAFEKFKENLTTIENGKNPYVSNATNDDFATIDTNEEKASARRLAEEDYMDNIITNAIDSGNLDLLEAYVEDGNIATGFAKKLNLNQKDALDLQNRFINRIKTTKQLYLDVLDKVNSLGGNYNVGTIIARDVVNANNIKRIYQELGTKYNNAYNAAINKPGVNITAEDISAIQEYIYHTKLENIDKDIHNLELDASNTNSKEEQIRSLKEKKNALLKNAPVAFEEYTPERKQELIKRINEIERKYNNEVTDIAKKFNNDYQTIMAESEIDLDETKIKKKINYYNNYLDKTKKKIIDNALSKYDSLYEKYGNDINDETKLSENDRNELKTINKILEQADISKAALADRRRIIDILKENQRKYDEEVKDNTEKEESVPPTDVETDMDDSSTGNQNQSDTEVTDTDNAADTADVADTTDTAGSTESDKSESKPPVEESTDTDTKSDNQDTETTDTAPDKDKEAAPKQETEDEKRRRLKKEHIESLDDDDKLIECQEDMKNYFVVLAYQQKYDANNVLSNKQQIIDYFTNVGYYEEDAELAFEQQFQIFYPGVEIIEDGYIKNGYLSSLDEDEEFIIFNSGLAIARNASGDSLLKSQSIDNVKAVLDRYSKIVRDNNSKYVLEVNGKVYINVEELIDYIRNLTGRDPYVSSLIIEPIVNFIDSKENDKYVLTDKKEFFNLSAKQLVQKIRNYDIEKLNELSQISNSVNIIGTTDANETQEYFNELVKLSVNDELDYKIDHIRNRIYLIGKDGNAVGYMGIPNMTSDGTYTRTNKSWKYELYKDKNGQLISPLKTLFQEILDPNSNKYNNIRNIIYKYINNSSPVSNTDIDSLIKELYYNNPQIKNILEVPSDTHPEFRNKMMIAINHLFEVSKYHISRGSNINQSIEDWFEKLYNSYQQTIAASNGDLTGKFIVSGIRRGKLNVNENTRNDILDVIPDYDENKQVLYGVIGENKVLVGNESEVKIINNFNKGVRGLMIFTGNIGQIDTAHCYRVYLKNLSTNDNVNRLVQAAKKELKEIMFKYLNDDSKYTFDDIKTYISYLFDNDGLFGNTKLSLRNNNAGIKINNGNTWKITFNTPFNDKSKNIIIDGNIKITKNDFDKNSDIIDKAINELFENSLINIPFRYINDRLQQNTKGYYCYRENGKTIIKIGNERQEYTSYQDFLVKNKLIKTTLAKPSETNGVAAGNYVYDDSFLYVKFSPNTQIKKEDEEEIITDNNKMSIDDADRLNKENVIDFLNDKLKEDTTTLKHLDNLDRLKVIPKNVEVQNINETTFPIYALYDSKNKKIVFNKDRLESLTYDRFIRTLVHETIHNKLDDVYYREDALERIEPIYNKFVEYVNSLEDGKLKQSANKFINIRPEKDKNLEEFLVESLTNAELISILNSIPSNEKLPGKYTKFKSLFQKLIEAIMDLLGVDINKNSLLYEEFVTINKIRRKKTKRTTSKIKKEKVEITDTIPIENPDKDVNNDNQEVEIPPIIVDNAIDMKERIDMETGDIVPENTINDNLNLNDDLSLDDDLSFDFDNSMGSTINEFEYESKPLLQQSVENPNTSSLASLAAAGKILMYC